MSQERKKLILALAGLFGIEDMELDHEQTSLTACTEEWPESLNGTLVKLGKLADFILERRTPAARLKRLEADSRLLQALRESGVDNWDGWADANRLAEERR